jgi:hypothetical protein
VLLVIGSVLAEQGHYRILGQAMRITINGKRYKLVRRRLKKNKGICNAPDDIGKAIVIDSRCKKSFLRILIHEILHAADWSKDEKWVNDTSRSLARILEQVGEAERLGFNTKISRKPRN